MRPRFLPTAALAVLLLAACGGGSDAAEAQAVKTAAAERPAPAARAAAARPAAEDEAAVEDGLAVATFAGGCFWCMEPPFDALEGVVSTTSGYIGGAKDDPTYEEVSAGGTGHAEAVEIRYDPAKVSYGELLEVYWLNVNPTVADRQFCDVGDQYRTAIFAHGPEQRRLAEASRRRVARELGTRVHTEIADAGTFHPAEEYHQDYYQKNPIRYRFYRTGCGRDARLRELWGERAGGGH
jgi:peptide-methionine (S)-S-oxide reductase